ncbi:MAG: divergent polysaccharide deacetylase family protein [Pseudomonadota bacterium]
MAAKKKKKGSIKGKKGKHRRVIAVFALTGFILLSVLSYLFYAGGKIEVPAYEKAFSHSSELELAIGAIDRAIYKALYQGKISEGNVLFLSVKPRRKGGNEWDFTELLIKFPKKEPAIQFDVLLQAGLNRLGPKVRYETKTGSEGGIEGMISALGFFTHRLKLTEDGSRRPLPQRLPKVSIIIDDLGYDFKTAKALINLDLPLTLSLLPLAPYRENIVKAAVKKGSELMLHLPMEPRDYPRLNPGPGALFSKMDDEEIRNLMGEHLNRIPGVRGVNNHMGSYFTERRDKMRIVLEEIRKRGLFFVDSRTTSGTIAFDVAESMGIGAGKRSVFLDNDPAPKAVIFQLERLMGAARHSGSAIGIGHPHRETLRILKEFQQRLNVEFEMVPVSELVG